jgi:hypothetical protein
MSRALFLIFVPGIPVADFRIPLPLFFCTTVEGVVSEGHGRTKIDPMLNKSPHFMLITGGPRPCIGGANKETEWFPARTEIR